MGTEDNDVPLEAGTVERMLLHEDTVVRVVGEPELAQVEGDRLQAALDSDNRAEIELLEHIEALLVQFDLIAGDGGQPDVLLWQVHPIVFLYLFTS